MSGWEGSLDDVAKALENVGGVPVKTRLAMPIFLRRLFLKDLHHMFCYYEEVGPKGAPEDFKKILPNAVFVIGAADARKWKANIVSAISERSRAVSASAHSYCAASEGSGEENALISEIF